MTKQVKYDKRVFLPKGAQRKFIESVQFKLDTGIDDIAVKHGMVTMLQDGLLKALNGITSVDEVFRVAAEKE